MSLRTLSILKDSAEPIEIAVAAHDAVGAEYDWTAQTLKVQAQLLGSDYVVADWETGATAYTLLGRRWLRIGPTLLATARAAKGTYCVYYWIDCTDDPVKQGCVLKVS